MRSLAFFSIFSPRRMGIADYSDDLVAALARHFAITCYVENPGEPDRVRDHAAVKPHTAFRGREDLVLHQIGNSTELSFVLPHLVKHGGAVTLHDASQHDITHPYFQTHRLRFWTEVFRSLDPAARRLLIRPSLHPLRMVKAAVATYQRHPEKRRHFAFTRFVLRHAHRVIVHSRFLGERVRALRPGLAVDTIPHGIHPAAVGDRAEARRRLGQRHGVAVGPETIVFLSFGAIQAHKRIQAVLKAFGAFLAEHPDAVYVLVGPRDPDYDLDAEVAAQGVGRRVRVLDAYLPLPEVNACINAADLCFNLRWPSLGSTSGTLHKIFAVGRPAAVTAAESFAEYPPDFTFAVPPPGPGGDEWRRCLEIMRLARDDPARLRAMGVRARKFANETCSWERIADRYAEVLTRT